MRRAIAFAATLGGEAALLSGDVEAADRRLSEAVDLHHGIGSLVGESHTLQRLAEVRIATGEPTAARRLLARSLPLARWSHMARCLLPPIYGTQIALAADGDGVATIDEAVAALGADDHCFFCSIMLNLPAAKAYRRPRPPRHRRRGRRRRRGGQVGPEEARHGRWTTSSTVSPPSTSRSATWAAR
ncbi:hypothetical protein [Georgenia sp. SUBG003]|uniref:hypothetical protein n=1 Tax=Georgenia sp. SUBG003 TaxID=1497974 RepID=UPI003AB36BCE